MKTHGKRYVSVAEKIEPGKKFSFEEGTKKIKEVGSAKFDETLEIAVRLGVNPAHADQMVRGTVVLPSGTGKTVRVLVVAQGEKLAEATAAGADFVGSEDMIEKMNKGWLDFDVIVATPDMMGALGKLGKVLGPRGLMPNPKSGTVTFDVASAIKQIREGKINFRVDKGGVVHAILGKVSFEHVDIMANTKSLLEALVKLKPSSAKGRYIKGIALSTTMGPAVRLDEVEISNMLRVS